MKYLVTIVVFLLVVAQPTYADPSIRLRVSATIAPKPCELPNRCDAAVMKAVPAAATRVSVEQGKVSYVGSPPTVEVKDDLLVVKF